MIGDPLMPHLMDVLARPELGGLILAGGFGIRVKQEFLAQTQARTLISPFPLARATGDLDLFLRMEVFGNVQRKDDMRRAIDELGYEPTQRNWQFRKPLGERYPTRSVTLDLLSRRPQQGENVRFKDPRVGEGSLHGRDTEEAFAIDVDPIPLPIRDRTSAGDEIEAVVLVPHPYAWLNMKVRAAHDWLRRQRGEMEAKEFSEKHAFDVYVLVAMLTEEELLRCGEIAGVFESHKLAAAIRAQAQELFATSASPGFLEARRQVESDLDFEAFHEGLGRALGYLGGEGVSA